MISGRITDNNRGEQISKVFGAILSDHHQNTLEKWSGRKVSKLYTENLLVFPRDLHVYGDKISDMEIYNLSGQTLSTGNILGFLGQGNMRLTIHSRFDPSTNDYFMHYMLQKVFCLNVFDMSLTGRKDPIWDFLIYIFPYFLKNALRQGFFRKYHLFHYNNNKFSGTLDVSRHLKHNVPFTGRVAHNSREYSYDNPLSQLIRHTIEFIQTKPCGNHILHANPDTREAVRKIIGITPSYSRLDRLRVINMNLRQISHPFYTEYIPLQKICLQILRLENLSYGAEPQNIYGILFDGAWLWEEYLNTILCNSGFVHPQNRERKNPVHIFNSRKCRCYPDFYHEQGIIIDAKYKRISSYLMRNDLYQIIAYLHIKKAEYAILLYPLNSDYRKEIKNAVKDLQENDPGTSSGEDLRTSEPEISSVEFEEESPYLEIGTLNGHGGKVAIYGLHIPSGAKSYEEFCEKIKNEEKRCTVRLQEIIEEAKPTSDAVTT